MRDHKGNVIATGLSPPILITDDHKSTRQKKGTNTSTPCIQRKRTRSSCMEDEHRSKSPRSQHPVTTPSLTSSRPGSLSPLPLLADSQLLHSAPSSALPTPCDERRLSSLFDANCCNDNSSAMLPISSTQPHPLEQQHHHHHHHPHRRSSPTSSCHHLQQCPLTEENLKQHTLKVWIMCTSLFLLN